MTKMQYLCSVTKTVDRWKIKITQYLDRLPLIESLTTLPGFLDHQWIAKAKTFDGVYEEIKANHPEAFK